MLNSPRLKTLAPHVLDIFALIGWGALLFKYWITGQLNLLIHPNYFNLVLVTSIILFLLGLFKIWTVLKQWRQKAVSQEVDNILRITLLPHHLGTGLLVLAALLGLLIAPRPLSSQIAMQRGISESLPLTRVQAQSFRATVKPEDKTLIDWVRTINAYPEPDAYTGQPAKVSGFVVHLPQLPDNYLLISRFILTCCAVDAYPVGLPVKLSTSRSLYPVDTWLEIEGEMSTETLPMEVGKTDTRRQLAIAAKSITSIPTPADPYGY
jgi:putative membrane protein